jgi:DNA-binding NtrC family response regulator
MAQLLLIDDEPNMRWVLQEALTKAGYTVQTAPSGEEALTMLARHPIDLVVLDLKLKGMDGLATLRQIHQRWPEVVVLILTAYGTISTAVEALQGGASDYLRKPFDVEEVLFKISRALERHALQQEVQRLRAAPPPPTPGSAPAWRQAIEASVRSVAQGIDLVLVGEAGSGRASLARMVHANGPRHRAPLVEVDLATLAPAAQAVMLGGDGLRQGFWAAAGQGTLLLRHATHLSDSGKTTLASLLQRRATQGVGPLLIVTDTVAAGSDEQTLYHHAIHIRVPPLREHADDIVLFMQHWLPQQSISPAALTLLQQYPWPGNLSELRGIVERAAQLAAGQPIEERHLPERVRATPLPDLPYRLPNEGVALEAVEITLIKQALDRAGGNKTRAAELLGLTRHTLLYRMEKHQIGDGS